MANMGSETSPGLAAALTFLRSFPEAQSFNVLLLTTDKKPVLSRPQASQGLVHEELPRWLQMSSLHVFIRPNMGNLVLIDADNFQGKLETLVSLQPRCLVETSKGNYQVWLTLDDHLTSKSALQVTKDLSKALGADMASAKTTQVGRLPGSVNVKVGKGNRVLLLHSCLQNMNEQAFLQVVPDPKLAHKTASQQVCPATPKRNPADPDRSAQDWAMVCAFLEANPDMDVAMAHEQLRGKFLAVRPNQTYYEQLTIRKAHQHTQPKLQNNKKTGQPTSTSSLGPSTSHKPTGKTDSTHNVPNTCQPEAVQDGKAQETELGRKQVSPEDVQRMIQQALYVRFPAPTEQVAKACSQCHKEKVRNLFAHTQWTKKEPLCLECKPVDESKKGRAKATKACTACGNEVDRAGFSNTQWLSGSSSKCRNCTLTNTMRQPKRVKVCKLCNKEKCKEDFSPTQWEMNQKQGSQCKECCKTRVENRQGEFAKAKAAAKQAPDPAASPTWPSEDKTLAQRWLIEAPLLALPSENLQSYQAMYGIRGKQNWTTKQAKPDNSGIPPKRKQELLTTAHEELSHTGGRDAIVTALTEEGKTWNNMALDAQWVVNRCEACRTNSTRDLHQANTRHLPTPGLAGEVIGFDLKTVKPHNGPRWLMLLAVDFCSKKCFAWDLDCGQGDLETVQGLMLKFFCEQELPLVVWTDNGGPFRNVIQVALQKVIGASPRHIPPGRPQANGLVEVYNRILDTAHAGQRTHLQSAVLAYNNMPQARFGASPETLWRILRPPQSRWRNLQLAAVVHGPSPSMTDSEWLSFLEKSSNLDVDYFRKAADSYQASLEPIREAMASKQVRQAMQKKMKYVHKKAQTGEAPLLSGDRVIAKNSQYTTKTGCGKFETKDGHVREYTVLSVSQGFVQLQEQGTRDTTFKHEANLKLMPRALPPDDDQLPSPPPKLPEKCRPQICGPYQLITAGDDGACLYRALQMALNFLRGTVAEELVDDGDEAQALRSKLLLNVQLWLRGLSMEEAQMVAVQLAAELLDDPKWVEPVPWDWDHYYTYASQPRVYATFFNLAAFVRHEGITVEVYQKDPNTQQLVMAWTEAGVGDGGAWRGGPIRLLRSGNHYDLLLPRKRQRRSTAGTCSKRACF